MSNRSIWILTGLWAAALILFIPLSSLTGPGFSYTLRSVSLGGALLGAISGGLGSFAVLRKQSLLGDALSHAALPGVGIAFLVAGRELWALLLGASAASFLGVGFISLVTRNSRIKQDGAMGIVLAGWFALGIGILAYIQQRPDASQAGLDSFIFGQAAAIVRKDVLLLVGVAVVLLLILLLFWKEFKLITFDPDFAAANGYPVKIITAILLSLIVISVVMGLQLAGVVLMVGLLIAPGIAARQWTNRLEQMVALGAVIGASSGGMGAILSSLDRDLPTGPMIIVVVSVFVAISLIFAPARGLLWKPGRKLSRPSDAPAAPGSQLAGSAAASTASATSGATKSERTGAHTEEDQ
ncbi:metal ABC transporter permease [Salinispira pacifica]|uniref:Manganese ABC transporter, inner membrane permease protein SitC n=1 Tax=Salinispira pacifica TaxID=1307761 RepID=V5WEA0_9SPIO|nr:iron chelate uptake ABC transporter family permease subunit [Salinispira pacifica]AHC13965.1 Manganese ABC transporter, inner membrane permease protein SitC [Salinispira pacifica]